MNKDETVRLRELLAKAEGKKLFTPEHANLLGALKENLPYLLDTAERAHALEADNKRLREALAPFVKFADELSDEAPNDCSLALFIGGATVFGPGCPCIGDLRRARAALKGEGA